MIKMLYCVLDARRQVPGDMLAYQGKNNVAVETKLAAVRSQVGAMQALIDKVRSCGRVAFVGLSSSYVCDLLSDDTKNAFVCVTTRQAKQKQLDDVAAKAGAFFCVVMFDLYWHEFALLLRRRNGEIA